MLELKYILVKGAMGRKHGNHSYVLLDFVAVDKNKACKYQFNRIGIIWSNKAKIYYWKKKKMHIVELLPLYIYIYDYLSRLQ